MSKSNKKQIIIGVTGSIAAYKACDIICRLKESGISVTAVMTKEAEQFVTPFLLGHISSNPVYTDMFTPLQISRACSKSKFVTGLKAPDVWSPEHISLADGAGLVLIAPATANIIAKVANGICDDLLTFIVMATKAPVLIAPAMNSNMYNHKATQENIKRLKSFGYKFIGPAEGRLACGTIGLGHIASTEEIVRKALVSLRGGAKRRRSNLLGCEEIASPLRGSQ